MTHDFDGAKYRKASAHQQEWGAKLMGELALKGNERILDLGCGDGTVTNQLAELVPEGYVIGIDASPGMIAAALSRQRENLRFCRLDINDMGYANEFDVVFSNAALHWVHDHRSLLSKVRCALRPGGRICFNFAGEGNCASFYRLVRGAMELPEYAACFSAFLWPWYMPSVEAYAALVRGCGFPKARVAGEHADRFFEDVDALVRWIDQPSLVPFLACLPEELRGGFRDLVVQRMIRETAQPDGSCFETFRRIKVIAEI